jgi:hypothetical protein
MVSLHRGVGHLGAISTRDTLAFAGVFSKMRKYSPSTTCYGWDCFERPFKNKVETHRFCTIK